MRLLIVLVVSMSLLYVVSVYILAPKGRVNDSSTPKVTFAPEPRRGQAASPTPMATTTTTSGDSTTEIPPLYPGVQWEPARFQTSISFCNSDLDTVKRAGYSTQSVLIKTYPWDLMNEVGAYYDSALTANGWKRTCVASGMDVEKHGFEKAGRYFNFGLGPEPFPDTQGNPTGFRFVVEHN